MAPFGGEGVAACSEVYSEWEAKSRTAVLQTGAPCLLLLTAAPGEASHCSLKEATL